MCDQAEFTLKLVLLTAYLQAALLKFWLCQKHSTDYLQGILG